MGRSLTIDEPAFWRDPLKPEGELERVTKGEVILRAVRQGLPDHLACRIAEMNRVTLFRWKANAAETEGLDDAQLTDNQRRLRRFCNDLTRAEAEAAHRALAVLESAALSDWRAALAMLERRFPSDFSKRIEIDSDPPDRDLTPLDAVTVAEVEEAFRAAALPEGDPASILPGVGESPPTSIPPRAE